MAVARTKLIVGSAAALLATGYLVFAGLSSGWTYYMDVDAARSAHLTTGQRVRIRGNVAPDARFDRLALRATFSLVGKTAALEVQYHGPIPETFEAGRDVVVEGSMDRSGTLQADTLMTKCSSKYEPAKADSTRTAGARP